MNIESKVESFVEAKDDLEMEEARELFNEQLKDVKENSTDAVGDRTIQSTAFVQFRSKYNEDQAIDADAETVDIIAIGHSGIQEWKNGDTLLAYGIANPEDEPANKGVFIIDGEDAPLGEIKEQFEPFNALEGNFSVSVSSEVSDLYVCNSTDETEVMSSEIDMTEGERHEWVNENHVTDRATLVDVTDHISQTNSQGYTAEFGGDIKRMQATVVDFYIPDDWSYGVLTLQDESVVDPVEELDEEVIGDDAENTRTPGLTGWIDPETITFGEYSVMDFYGTIARNDNGELKMNVFGAYPIMPTEPDFSDVGSGGGDGGVDDSAEEMSI